MSEKIRVESEATEFRHEHWMMWRERDGTWTVATRMGYPTCRGVSESEAKELISRYPGEIKGSAYVDAWIAKGENR